MATLESTTARVVRSNTPESFADPAFARARSTPALGLATWHTGEGEPGDYSDVFRVVDQGEGGDFDALPEWIVDTVVRLVEAAGADAAVVWRTTRAQ